MVLTLEDLIEMSKKPIYIKTEVFDINKKNDKKKPQKEIILN